MPPSSRHMGGQVLDAQYSNYAQYRFKMGPQESGPLLLLVGLMLAGAPRIFVPWLGLAKCILGGSLIFALGQVWLSGR